MAEKRNPGALAGAAGAGLPCSAEAVGTRNLAQAKGRAKRAGLYHVTPEGGEAFTIEATGRDAWALDRLRDAITARRNPATARALLDREADMRAALVAKLGGGDD